MAGLFAQPASASSRVVGWYGGLPSGDQYRVLCGYTFTHLVSNDITFQVCNYAYNPDFEDGRNYQAWGWVRNTNFTKKGGGLHRIPRLQ